jgi:SNF2 family DNA or RNA helicase
LIYTLKSKEGCQPYKWQEAAFKKLVPLPYAAILAEVGTGKSAELIYLLVAHYLAKEINAVLLFAPASMYAQWVDEQLPTHCAVPYITHLWDSTSTANKNAAKRFIEEKTDSLKFMVVNVEAMSHKTYIPFFKQFLKTHKAALAIDEATRIKNTESNRTANITFGLNDLLMYGKIITNLYYTSVYRYILTGTVVTNHPYDIYSMFRFLSYAFWKSPESLFRKRYGLRRLDSTEVCTPNGSVTRRYWKNLTKEDIRIVHAMLEAKVAPQIICASQNIDVEDVIYIQAHPSMTLPWKHLDELKQKIDPYSFSILLDDCFEEVPQKQFITLKVKMSEAQNKAYKELKATLMSRFGCMQITTKNKMTLALLCQRITGGFATAVDIMHPDDEKQLVMLDEVPSKYTVLKEDLEDSGEYPVIIFCRFVAEAKYIEDHLSKDIAGLRTALIVAEVNGLKIDKQEREERINKFKAGDLDVLIANPQCLSVGQNLQISHIEYLYSVSYSEEDYEQQIGRIRRATQKNKVCIYKSLVCPGTVDEHVYSVLKDKNDLLSYFQDTSLKDIL